MCCDVQKSEPPWPEFCQVFTLCYDTILNNFLYLSRIFMCIISEYKDYRYSHFID